MINQLILIFFVIAIYEYINYVNLKVLIISNFTFLKKIFYLFQFKKVSDSRKEKVILKYSNILLFTSAKVIIHILVIFFTLVLIDKMITSFIKFILSIYGFLEMSLIFIIYHVIKKKLNA